MLIDTVGHEDRTALATSLVVDDRGDVISAAPSVLDRLGWRANLVVGRPFLMLLDPREAPVHQAHLAGALATAAHQDYRTGIRSRSGDMESVRIQMDPVSIDGRRVVVITVSTATPSVTVPHDRMHPEAADLQPRTGTRSALALCTIEGCIDEDHHDDAHNGGLVSRTVAERIADQSRSTDIVARTSEDSLVIALVGVHDLRDARYALRRLRESAAAPVPTPEGTVVPQLTMRIAHARG